MNFFAAHVHVNVMVMSSAQDRSVMVGGNSAVYMLYSVGEGTPPCGTSVLN